MREALETWRPAVDDAIAEVLPRELTDSYLAAFFGEPRYDYDSDGLQRALADPIWDLLDRGGKRWRAVLFLTFVEGFGEDPDAFLPYAIIPEILHNGTIVVDDVEDGARTRRGEPAIHRVYGDDIALNAGNAMYFLPLKILANDPGDLPPERRLRAYEMLTTELNRTHLGQGLDICWHNERGVRATESEYLEMCACKTGCLGRIVARLAAIVTGQSEATEEAAASYAELTSIAFQIADDILDVEASIEGTDAFGKEFGNDVREGKTTLLVLHALREAAPADAERLDDILAAADPTTDDVAFVLDLFVETGAIDYAREAALDLADAARRELDAVDVDPDVREELAAFTRFVVDRDV